MSLRVEKNRGLSVWKGKVSEISNPGKLSYAPRYVVYWKKNDEILVNEMVQPYDEIIKETIWFRFDKILRRGFETTFIVETKNGKMYMVKVRTEEKEEEKKESRDKKSEEKPRDEREERKFEIETLVFELAPIRERIS